jgi:hypothetical protein
VKTTTVICEIMYRSLILHKFTLLKKLGFPLHGTIIVLYICIRFQIQNKAASPLDDYSNVDDYFMRTHYGNSALVIFIA